MDPLQYEVAYGHSIEGKKLNGREKMDNNVFFISLEISEQCYYEHMLLMLSKSHGS